MGHYTVSLKGLGMPIPNYQEIFLPLLKLVAKHGRLNRSDATQLLADEFSLNKSERRELIPSGRCTIIRSRTGWARTALKKAGLLTYPQRGIVEITERGKKVLDENLPAITIAYLRQFPEFLAFNNASNQSNEICLDDQSQQTPEERLESAHEQLKSQTLLEILATIKSCTPQFFEKLVLDTIVKIGYGGSRKDAAQAIGKSGDEGIDGIINEDRLGLDVIYLQAKRWEANVSRPEIQKFAGALHGKRAKKGIFITTSDFTSEAIEYVKQIDLKIILISGQQLVKLMWEHGVGLNTARTYEVKKLDSDYFSESTD